MNEVKVFFITEYRQNFVKNGTCYSCGSFNREVYDAGSAYMLGDRKHKRGIMITDDEMEALQYLHELKSTICKTDEEISVVDYVLFRREYDTDKIMEDYPYIITADRFISELSNDPEEFEEYTLGEECLLACAKREFVGLIVTDENQYEESFDSYSEAVAWLDSMANEIINETIISSSVEF